MRLTRPASEIAFALKRRVPNVVAHVERRHGFRLEDVLHRRSLPESQRFIHDLVLELHQRRWAPAEIARWLDTDQRAVERAIAQTRRAEATR